MSSSVLTSYNTRGLRVQILGPRGKKSLPTFIIIYNQNEYDDNNDIIATLLFINFKCLPRF